MRTRNGLRQVISHVQLITDGQQKSSSDNLEAVELMPVRGPGGEVILHRAFAGARWNTLTSNRETENVGKDLCPAVV